MQVITQTIQGELLERKKVGTWQVFFIVAIMAGIVVSEYIFAYHNVAYGIVIALALVLITYLVLSIFHLHRGIINCGESLVLVPLYILFTSSLPWLFINQQFLFAVMHLTWRSVPELGFVFIAGLVLGAFYLRTKSLVGPIIVHGVNNVMLVAVLPYLIGL